MQTYYIYGFYEGRKCVYVGQTANPKSRWRTHKMRINSPQAKPRILRTVQGRDDALRIERQIILAYKMREEADWNANCLRYMCDGRYFMSTSDMDKHAGVPVGRSATYLSMGNGLGTFRGREGIMFHVLDRTIHPDSLAEKSYFPHYRSTHGLLHKLFAMLEQESLSEPVIQEIKRLQSLL